MTTETGERVQFTVPLPPRALRRNSTTRNIGYRSALVREYQLEVWCAAKESPVTNATYRGAFVSRFYVPLPEEPWEKAHVHYTWYSTHETDADNIIASMKPALDVLKATGPRPLGIIRDDGPGVTVTAEWKRERVRGKARVEITVSRR